MKARTRKEYIEAWVSHVNELRYLYLDADVSDEFEEIKTEILAVADKAGRYLFPDDSE